MARSTPFLSLRRAVSWHRRKLAVLAAVVAIVAAVSAATPAPDPTVAVVVVAHDLAGGVTIRAGDMTVDQWPSRLVPAEAVTDPASVVGRTLVAPLTRGSALTRLSVLSPRSARSRPGAVIVAVKLADATLVQLLSVGDRVDILTSTPVSTGPDASAMPRASVVATDALLVTVPAAPADSGPIGSASSATQPSVIVVEVDQAAALRLTQAAASGPMTVVLR